MHNFKKWIFIFSSAADQLEAHKGLLFLGSECELRSVTPVKNFGCYARYAGKTEKPNICVGGVKKEWIKIGSFKGFKFETLNS